MDFSFTPQSTMYNTCRETGGDATKSIYISIVSEKPSTHTQNIKQQQRQQ